MQGGGHRQIMDLEPLVQAGVVVVDEVLPLARLLAALAGDVGEQVVVVLDQVLDVSGVPGLGDDYA